METKADLGRHCIRELAAETLRGWQVRAREVLIVKILGSRFGSLTLMLLAMKHIVSLSY